MRSERRTHDALAYAAEPLHPYHPPTYDYSRGAWLWVPPYFEGDAAVNPRDGEMLGRNVDDAEAALEIMRSKLFCAHGARIGVPCTDCRKEVVRALGDHRPG